MIIYDQKLDWYKNTYSASLPDIAPTIADRLGYQPPECWTGTSLHQNLKNFSLQLESAEVCQFPYGVVENKDSLLTMTLENNKRQPERTYVFDRKQPVTTPFTQGNRYRFCLIISMDSSQEDKS